MTEQPQTTDVRFSAGLKAAVDIMREMAIQTSIAWLDNPAALRIVAEAVEIESVKYADHS